MKSLLFLLCTYVNAPSFFDLLGFGHKATTKYECLPGSETKRDLDLVKRSEEPDAILKGAGSSSPKLPHEQNVDEILEFVKYEFYNLNCKINARQYYIVIFNFNKPFVEKINLVQIGKLEPLIGWILNEHENIEKLSRFLTVNPRLPVNAHILRRFAIDILTLRINCGCEESFKLLCSYMYCSSYSVVKKILTLQDSRIEDESQDSSPQDLKSKISEICNQLAKGVTWKKQTHIDVERLHQTCCNEQNLSSKSKRFWNNTIKNSQWIGYKKFENLPTCIRLILTDEAGELPDETGRPCKLKRLEEFAGCTFRADERLPLNFSETFWSVLSRGEE